MLCRSMFLAAHWFRRVEFQIFVLIFSTAPALKKQQQIGSMSYQWHKTTKLKSKIAGYVKYNSCFIPLLSPWEITYIINIIKKSEVAVFTTIKRGSWSYTDFRFWSLKKNHSIYNLGRSFEFLAASDPTMRKVRRKDLLG